MSDADIESSYAGLRRGELMGLRTGDVDVATGVIRVEQAYDPRSKEIIPPKSYAGRRKVPIAGLIRDTLIDARVRASDRNLELVFGRDDGRPFSYNGILDRAKRIWNLTASTRSGCTSAVTRSRR